MSLESRVNYLLHAAERADREGNVRLAGILRKMAEELGPAVPGPTPLNTSSPFRQRAPEFHGLNPLLPYSQV